MRPWAWNILSPGDILGIGDWSATLEKVEGASAPQKAASTIKRPTVDPAAPAASYEITGARKLPADLLAEGENRG